MIVTIEPNTDAIRIDGIKKGAVVIGNGAEVWTVRATDQEGGPWVYDAVVWKKTDLGARLSEVARIVATASVLPLAKWQQNLIRRVFA